MIERDSSPSGRQQCDAVRQRQLEAWQQGQTLFVEALLAAGDDQRLGDELLLELIYGEVLLREKQGGLVSVDEYVGRFPQLTERLRKLFEVHRMLPNPASDGDSAGPDAAATPAERTPCATQADASCPSSPKGPRATSATAR